MSASDLFAALDADWIDTSIVIDASLPLELSGEAIRGRICLFTDEDGREWALRPDVTLPAALDEIARRKDGAGEARTVRYDLPVFRLPRASADPIEYRQIGFERFGAATGPSQDAETFAAIIQACQDLGQVDGQLSLGDLSLFPAFIDALHLSDETANGLKRAFRQEGGVTAYLSAKSTEQSGFAKHLSALSEDEARDFVEDVFAMTGVKPVGVRSAEEIVERLTQQSAQAKAADLTPGTRSLIESFLSVEGAPSVALEQYRAIGLEGDMPDLAPAIDAVETRLGMMAQAAANLFETARFSTRFGRRFTYYDGFVFELARSDAASDLVRPYAAGGRYDGLLANLSAGEVAASAVGGVVMPHRFAGAKGDSA